MKRYTAPPTTSLTRVRNGRILVDLSPERAHTLSGLIAYRSREAWVAKLAHELRTMSARLRAVPLLSRSEFLRSWFGATVQRQETPAPAPQPVASPLLPTPLTAAAMAVILGAAYEGRADAVAELEKLIAAETRITEAAVLTAATRAQEAVDQAHDVMATATARAAEAMTGTVSQAAADLKDRTDADEARVAAAASLAASVVKAALETPGTDSATVAARIADIVFAVAAANTIASDTAATTVAEAVLAASITAESAASQADAAFLAAAGIAAHAAQTDAASVARQMTKATRPSRRLIAAAGDPQPK